MLEVKHLKAGYGGLTIVFDVSISVKEGQIVSLIGSNGVGKSTTLRAITGLIKPTGGSISFQGKPIHGMKPNQIVKSGISMVPEGRHLFNKMSVKDNLITGAYLIKDRHEVQKNLEEIYMLFPWIKDRLKQVAGTLSGGEQQMVAIARGLMCNPRLIIFDEPSLGLMPRFVEEMFEFIVRISNMGKTIVLVEQNMDEALKISDYAYVIKNGETVIEGERESILNNGEIKRSYLGM